jgi:chemotaxis methyl-accepting protein methylase/signal transduction histidine kinase
MAYVVILHLSPEHESRLAEVIQSSSVIPVMQVRDAVKVEPNHVYVIAPSQSLSMREGMLTTSDLSGFEERRAPIDIFFRTLADTNDARAVAVVMSGSGSDGSMGVRRVKEYGGLVVVQDPSEAAFNEMPLSSIGTGLADFVLPAASMPGRIASYRDHVRAIQIPVDEEKDAAADEQVLGQIFTQLRVRTGHDFSNYKRATVLRRLARRLAVRGISDLPGYLTLLREHPDEAGFLLKELLISVTNFFRDKEVFEVLERELIPRLFAHQPDEPVRIWVPGCATGEEAYSLAILLAEYVAAHPQTSPVSIFATDLDDQAISFGRAGVYSLADVADVSPERLRRFFHHEARGYRVTRDIREMVLFATHNLLKDPPFSRLDLISCRNVLIYLNRTAQDQALGILHFALQPAGYLLLGTSETADNAPDLFKLLDKNAHVYQRSGSARLGVSQQSYSALVTPSPPMRSSTVLERRSLERRTLPIELHHRLLEEYASPSLVTDDQYAIIHLSRRAGRYLEFTGGEASLNLLTVVRPELQIELRAALLQAAQSRATVEARGLSVQTEDRVERVNLVVRPLLRDGKDAHGFFLVLFEQSEDEAGQPREKVSGGEPMTRRLEDEMVRLRTQMRISIEQYEAQTEELKAANEELQAMNEELRSTAEELETSQEELQSVNEELQTVNEELKIKIDETTRANDDMRNLMSSTPIGTIFLDRSLRVKLFTPRVRDLFNVIPADVGRALTDITSRIPIGDLVQDVDGVLTTLQSLEREVKTSDDRWHLMKIVPYRTGEDRIDGVVITLLDITSRKATELHREELLEKLRIEQEALRKSREELERRVEERTVELAEAKEVVEIERSRLYRVFQQSPALIAVFAGPAHRFEFANDVYLSSVNRTRESVIGLPLREVFPELKGHDLGRDFDHVYETEKSVSRVETKLELAREPGQREERFWDFALQALREGGDEERRLVFHAVDVTEQVNARRRIETLLSDRALLLRQLVDSQEQERKRLSREMHDQMGQHIAALKIGLETIRRQGDSQKVVELKEIVEDLDRTIERLALELRPPALTDVGLEGGIGTLVGSFERASGVSVDVQTEIRERLPEAVEIALYRVLQEALTNVQKHARARHVSIIINRRDDFVQMIVEDDGRGFDTSSVFDEGRTAGRLGLLGIRERVALLGGSVNIESAPGSTTSLYVRLPLGRHA